MPSTQASKRKRKEMKKFRSFNLTTRCSCSKKIKGSSTHHYLCKKCWINKYVIKGHTIQRR